MTSFKSFRGILKSLKEIKKKHKFSEMEMESRRQYYHLLLDFLDTATNHDVPGFFEHLMKTGKEFITEVINHPDRFLSFFF